MKMIWSKPQEDIFRFVTNPSEDEKYQSLIIEAVAGSGKTTTLVELVRRLDPRLAIILIAFNKSIADELKRRVPAHAKVMTYHGCGFSVLKRKYPRCIVDKEKIGKIINYSGIVNEKQKALYWGFIMQMVGLAKMSGVGYLLDDVPQTYADIIDHHDIILQDGSPEEGIELTQKVLAKSIEDTATIDFNDMLYIPLIEDLPFYKNDIVLIDEAQDTDSVQRTLLHDMLKVSSRYKDDAGEYIRTGRLIAVGDRHQAIYGFRGADSEAMNKIQEEFDCAELPLSISYRCPKSVIAVAQRIVPQIEARPDAPEGEVTTLDKFTVADFTKKDAILCRKAAPLISQAFWFLKQRVPAKVLGRDLGANLMALIKKMKADSIESLSEKLEEYGYKETAKLKKAKKEVQAQNLQDKIDCINVLISNLPVDDCTIKELLASIRELFADNVDGCITLSTVHKAKGLEWGTVFILDRKDTMPSKWAKKKWMKEQESNIIYVATTRAMNRLVDINSKDVRDEA